MNPKDIAIILPAYNAAQTLRATLNAIPTELRAQLLLGDDGSRDTTLALARELGIPTVAHKRNYGYGANQKTCYREAMRRYSEATVIAMVHPDHQYPERLLPELVAPILNGNAAAVFGSRMLQPGEAKRGRMPWWKRVGNRTLTTIANLCSGLQLTEYHSGFRAYRIDVLRELPFETYRNDFVFDTEMIVGLKEHNKRIVEIPIPTNYFPQASQASFGASMKYGFGVIGVFLRHWHPRFFLLPHATPLTADALLVPLCAIGAVLLRPFPQVRLGWELSVIIVALGICYLLLSARPETSERTKLTIIGVLIVITVLAQGLLLLNWRAPWDPASAAYKVHDNVLQLEATNTLLSRGQNPYTATFYHTPLAQWPFDDKGTLNPSLEHVISLPWHLVTSALFGNIELKLFGWQDQRILYALCYAGVLFVGAAVARSAQTRRVWLVAFGLNPFVVSYLLQGRNDVFVFMWIFASLVALHYERLVLSGVLFGLALASKHFAIFLAPLGIIYLWYSVERATPVRDRIKRLRAVALPALVVSAALIIPFALWNFGAFWEDIIRYPAGTSHLIYPINGIGFSVLLLHLGLIATPFSYFPFWATQALFGLPILFVAGRYLMRHPTLSVLTLTYATLLLGVLFGSRFFNDNYVGFLLMLLALGVLCNNPHDRTTLAELT